MASVVLMRTRNGSFVKAASAQFGGDKLVARCNPGCEPVCAALQHWMQGDDNCYCIRCAGTHLAVEALLDGTAASFVA
jgi:hypothetical protein